MTADADKSLFSAQWYRVAGLRPRLRGQIELSRQKQRGQFWYLLVDRAGERMQRLNRSAYQFVGRCDGQLSVEQIWVDMLTIAPEDAMTQDEVVQLLVQLHGRSALQFDVSPDVESIFKLRDSKERRARRSGVNPFAFRLPMIDPSRLLNRLRGLGRVLFSAWAGWAWLAIVIWAVLNALPHWRALGAHLHDSMGTSRGLFASWLIYPAIKLIHELAHGLAVHRFGGRVRQAGITLLMLTPVPFVNASAADSFRDRHQRIIVSAAGIMAELLLASLALAVWLQVQPGLVRDIALAVMFIGSASTLLINGNPLLRFDGYYVLCDAFDLRNLATRSSRYWIGRLNRHVLGLNSQRFLDPLPGERGWLIAYAPLAWIYRVSLSLAIALWVGSQSEVLGVIVGATSCWSLFGAPLWSLFAHLRGSLLRETARMQLAMRIAALATVVVLLFGVVPLPFNTVAEGVVWPPDKAQLRNETEGFLASFVVPDGAQVKTGDLLIVMRDDNLAATRAGNQSDVVELESQLFQAMETDPGKVPNLNQKLEYARAQLARIEQRIEKLQIRAKTDGVVVLPHQQDLLGSFHKQGELLGYLLTNEPLTVRVALPQQDAALVRSALNKVDVRLAEYGSNTHAGRVSLDMPATVDQLPSQALGDRGGGQILTDAADKNGLKTRTSVVLMDVAVPDFRTSRIGGRALVRFDHGQLPLALQALRQLQQLVLHTFNPGS